MQALNAGGDTVPTYTVITTRYDVVVTPYSSAFLTGPVTNITVQNGCGLDFADHLSIMYDRRALRYALTRSIPPTRLHPRALWYCPASEAEARGQLPSACTFWLRVPTRYQPAPEVDAVSDQRRRARDRAFGARTGAPYSVAPFSRGRPAGDAPCGRARPPRSSG